jgi:hypothetical protein
MEIKEIKTIMLEASEGHILTNGKSYGKVVALGSTDSADNWYEITLEEYNEIEAEQTEDMLIEE